MPHGHSRKLAGKVAVVTGGAGGMGRGYALRLAELGADIVIADIDLQAGVKHGEVNGDSVESEVRNLGRHAVGIQADLSTRAGAENAISAAVDAFGRLDILINNAGGAITPAERSSAVISPDEDIDLLLRANLLSAVYCCQAAAPVLTGPGGSIINISTIGAQLASQSGTYAIYSAAKAAVENYTKSLAAELGPAGVRVNAVAPGLIMTPRVVAAAKSRGIGTQDQASRIPLRRLGSVEDVVGAIEFLATDLSTYITGECLTVSGGLTTVSIA